MYYLYLLRCKDNTLYCGITNNIKRRIKEHNTSNFKSAKYTKIRRPVKLVYSEKYETLKESMQREREIKKWPKKKKIALISGALKNTALSDIRHDFLKIADLQRANNLRRFFKTGKGEYGEGDKFLGVTVPDIRIIVKKYNSISLKDTLLLLRSKFHEQRLCALLILVEKYKKGNDKQKQEIYHHYLKNTKRINNWDLVDLTAPNIIGNYLLNRNRQILSNLMKSDNLWERRIAVLSCASFIRKNDFTDIFNITEYLIRDKHDLIHKACGWMLREVGKRDQVAEETFLKKHYQTMPRTMLRYAIEKFDPVKKAYYMKKVL